MGKPLDSNTESTVSLAKTRQVDTDFRNLFAAIVDDPRDLGLHLGPGHNPVDEPMF